MKLFEITNGWMGNSYVRLLCVAESKEKALKLAMPKFEKDGKRQNHPDFYWKELNVTILCDDVSKSWCGEVSDE